MKILCVIDSLGSGGAQRQMVNLAHGLKENGHEVEMFIYFPDGAFFRPLVEGASIPVHEVKKGLGFSFNVLFTLIRLFRQGRYSVVISYLIMPSIYCELAKLVYPRVKLIVSERSSNAADGSRLVAFFRRLLHIVADGVVTNSRSHGNWLRNYSWLRNRITVIYNGFEILPWINESRVYRLEVSRYLAIGRIASGKNALGLIRGLILYQQKHGNCPVVSWVGRRESSVDSSQYFEKIESLLVENPAVATNIHWLGERSDVSALLNSHDALIHPSLYEGLPNVICEAFIAGRPVIASDVCDHPFLVVDGLRGILFDPLSPEAICQAIERFENLSDLNRAEMGMNARNFAEKYLTIERMVNSHERLIHELRN